MVSKTPQAINIFRRLRNRFFGGEAGHVFRGMATLAMGTGTARLVGLACIPLLTRIYTPSDYGVLAIFSSLVSVVAPILGLRYALAIPLPRTDGMAMNLMALSSVLLLVTGIVAILLLWLFGPIILTWISMEVLIPWRWLVVLGAMATALYETLSMWATRQRAYSVIARTQVTQSVLGEGVKLALGLLAFKPFGLLLGQIVSQSSGASAFLVQFRHVYKKNRVRIRYKRMAFLLHYYRSFPQYRLPSVVLLSLSVQAPLILT
jgi:O-antigen/teichoic acid export membrane protein